jgi:hypothetical protein
MLGRIAKVTILMLAAICVTALNVAAQAPTTISYQGRLTNAAGQPITVATSVVFTIYDLASGGSSLYTVTQSITPDANGIFTTELGPLGAGVFDGSKRYLGIKAGADAEMTPRQLLTSAPYAFNSNQIADNAITSAKIAPGTIASSDLADGAVTTTKILDGTVANADLAANAVDGGKVADGSLSKADIADEPGLAFRESVPANNFRAIPAGTTALDSITITVPGGGYVYVWAHTDLAVNHVLGAQDEIYLQVSTTAGTINYGGYGFAQVMVPSVLPTQTSRFYCYPIDCHRAFPVASAGAYKFYVNCNVISGSSSSDSFFNLQLTAMYFPTAYGTVDKAGAASGGKPEQLPTGATSQTGSE